MFLKITSYIIVLLFLFQCANQVKETPNEDTMKDSAKEAVKDATKEVVAVVKDVAEKKKEERLLNLAYAEEKSIKKQKDPKEIAKAKTIFTEANTLYKIKKNDEAALKYEEGLEIATDAEAYYRYGNVLSNINKLEESIKAYDISITMGFEKDYHALYNKACALSRLKKAEETYENIFLSIEKGYKAVTYMAEDPDLEYVRSLPDWKAKYKEIKKRAKEKEEVNKTKG